MGRFEQLPILKTQKAMLIKGAGGASRKQDTVVDSLSALVPASGHGIHLTKQDGLLLAYWVCDVSQNTFRVSLT